MRRKICVDASQRERLTSSKVEAIREKARRLLQTPAGERDKKLTELSKPAMRFTDILQDWLNWTKCWAWKNWGRIGVRLHYT